MPVLIAVSDSSEPSLVSRIFVYMQKPSCESPSRNGLNGAGDRNSERLSKPAWKHHTPTTHRRFDIHGIGSDRAARLAAPVQRSTVANSEFFAGFQLVPQHHTLCSS